MPVRRFVYIKPRMRVVANADLDIVITLREAAQPSSVDSVTATTPALRDPINLTGFTELRGQLRATIMTGSTNLVSHQGDDTPRATMALTILGDPTNGQVRARVNALRLWTMQQSRVTGGVFDITGKDGNGVAWSLVSEGEFDLIHGVTAPFTPYGPSPATVPVDRFAAPDDIYTIA